MRNAPDIEFQWKCTKVHFGVIFTVMLFLLSLLAQDNHFTAMNNELLKVERERMDLEQERDRLALQSEHLKNPGRIRTMAVEQLQMITPDPAHVYNLGVTTP